MQKHQLGRSDIEISSIGLGCWQFSKAEGVPGRYWGKLAAETIREIVSVSLREGINWFDTAEAYGWGTSEAALADALKACGCQGGDVVVATKWFPLLRRASSIQKTIGERLRRLSGFPIDLHQVHFPASLSSIRRQMDRMADLHAQSKIRAIGVSNFSAAQMRRSHEALQDRGLALASNQVRYNLLDRRIERNGVLDTARRLGVTIIAYSPLAQGLLSGKYHHQPELIRKRAGPRKHMKRFKRRGLEKTVPLIEELRRLAGTHHATPSQVALSWLIRFHGGNVVAIPGAYTPEQAAENAAAGKLHLSREELNRLDEISRGIS